MQLRWCFLFLDRCYFPNRKCVARLSIRKQLQPRRARRTQGAGSSVWKSGPRIDMVCQAIERTRQCARSRTAFQVEVFEEGRNAGNERASSSSLLFGDDSYPWSHDERREGHAQCWDFPGLLPSCIPDFIPLGNLRASECVAGESPDELTSQAKGTVRRRICLTSCAHRARIHRTGSNNPIRIQSHYPCPAS